MDLYVIRRRNNWKSPEELEATAARSSAEGEKMSDEDKEELTSMAQDSNGQPDLNEVAAFFKDKFEQKDLVQHLAEATETVLREFAESIQNKDEASS